MGWADTAPCSLEILFPPLAVEDVLPWRSEPGGAEDLRLEADPFPPSRFLRHGAGGTAVRIRFVLYLRCYGAVPTLTGSVRIW